MTETHSKNVNGDDVPAAEKRFSKAALDYMDALIALMTVRQERQLENDAIKLLMDQAAPSTPLPDSQTLLAGHDFPQSMGWSAPSDDAQPACWMGLTGGLVLGADVRKGGTLTVLIPRAARRRFLDGVEIRINGFQAPRIDQNKQGGQWELSFNVPQLDWHWPSAIQITAPRQVRRSLFKKEYGSIAVSRVRFDPAP